MRTGTSPTSPRRAAGLALLLVALHTAPLHAQTLVLEVYSADYVGDSAAAGIGLEYDARPFARNGRAEFSLGAGLTYDQRGNLWIGAGPVAHVPLGQRWFTEASLMPGFYAADGADYDLGSVLEFRTSLELGYRLDDRTSLGLAVHHLSNADLAPDNPGTNSFGLRLHRDF